MPWVDGHIRVNHPREPWDEGTPDIIVQTSLNSLKGKSGSPNRAIYERAKRGFDMEAAYEVVQRCLTKVACDSIVAHVIAGGLNARIVMPHPDFDDEEGGSPERGLTNAIPFAYADSLHALTGRPIDQEIVQSARVGRTKLSKMQRFLYQPSFGGAVRTDEPYILVDDVATTGGTLAALRSYIIRNGGQVLFATVLANHSAKNQPFPISVETHRVLTNRFGIDFEPFWRETIGHEATCLTEFEGRALGDWCNEQAADGDGGGKPLLHRLRARLDAVAAT